MNCEKVNVLIEALHDGALDTNEKAGMEEHLTGCFSCRKKRERLSALSALIQKSSVPEPSASLEQNLLQAFSTHHEKPAKSPVWWRQIFAGSVSIPKPVFAAALIAVAVIVTAANLIGRNAANTLNAKTNFPAQVPVISAPLASPEVIEQTRFVEVPVVKERIVTRVVYVEQKGRAAGNPAQNRTLIAARKELRRSEPISNPKETSLTMNGSVAENGYFTRIDLTGFRPTKGMNARVVREEKNDEK
jgi:anti-sigma factor RsiW